MTAATPIASPAAAAPEEPLQDVAAGVVTSGGAVVCPIAHTLRVLATTKWTGYVIRELLAGPKRFGEIRAGVGDANPKPLTDTLRRLEDVGLITRAAYAEMPPRVVYELTERGHSLGPVLHAMAEWGSNDLRKPPP